MFFRREAVKAYCLKRKKNKCFSNNKKFHDKIQLLIAPNALYTFKQKFTDFSINSFVDKETRKLNSITMFWLKRKSIFLQAKSKNSVPKHI